MSSSWLNKLLQKPQTLRGSTSDMQSTTMEQGETSHFDTSPRTLCIFALVVGIDTYKSPELSDLSGCKNDAKRFIRYLTGVLGVPSPQIVFLADEEATESAILEEFDRFLIYNTDIQRDDAIIFFFAGHGSRMQAPDGWVTESGKIEVLCPHDVQTTGEEREMLWGISDRAIDALMRKLAFEKGDNIIAVFDCCFSGGLSRDGEATLRPRAIPPPPHPPPADLQKKIWSSIPDTNSRAGMTVIPTGFQYKAMTSHVHLAACRPDEVALENPNAKDEPGGLFTAALVESLRCHSIHDTSYAKLLETLDLKYNQHPQCEGTNKDRLLFSLTTLRDGRAMFKVSERRDRLYVSAGTIHGIVEGTEFTLQSSAKTLVLKARTIGPFETKLEGNNHGITEARAFVSSWGHPTLKVHSSIHLPSSRVTIVEDITPADVALRHDNSEWELERFDPLIPVFSDPVKRFNADERQLTDILDTIANFNAYLYRSDGAAPGFAGKVKTRLNRLESDGGEFGPAGEDLFRIARLPHLDADVEMATVTDLDSKYCLTLENFSDVDLFPYFFYLDPSNYEIQEWYVPPWPTMRAPLQRCKPDGSPSLFAFGYGGFGTDPIEFYLPPECEADSVFLKVFLTTMYADMTHVAQSGIGAVVSSRGTTRTLAGAWTCETFVLTCQKS